MTDNASVLLFRPKQIRILLALSEKNQEWNLTSLAKATNTTYVHTSRFISRCENVGLVGVDRHGRIKSLRLTEKGVEVAKGISSIVEKLGEVKKDEATTAPTQHA
jgi:predicted transcriptional regulator